MAEAPSVRKSVVSGVVLCVFLVSGTTGLVYEVAWARCFGTVFGNTVFAASTVLTSFMLGMAIGSYLFGRYADTAARPLRLYAVLELGIGLYALVFPLILRLTDVFYIFFYRRLAPSFHLLSIVRFLLSTVILLPPTVLMGGTLPVLVAFWIRRGSTPSRRTVSLLYAVNSFGAAFGCFLAGYVLLRRLGIASTIYTVAAANIAISLVAMALSVVHSPVQPTAHRGMLAAGQVRRPAHAHRRPPSSQMQSPASADLRVRRAILATVAAAGFCSLALEVLWTRVLVFVLGTSVYAFACMLTCFIFGLALGSLLCTLFIHRIKHQVLAVAVCETFIGLTALASLPILSRLWGIDYDLLSALDAFDFWREISVHFLDAAMILLAPTVLMGIALPIAMAAFAIEGHLPSATGAVYAANTLGCVLGAFAAGFILVPVLGLRTAFLVVIALQLAAAAFLLQFAETRGSGLPRAAVIAAAATVVIAFLAVPSDVFVRTMNTFHYPSEVVYIQDDVTGTITVHDLPDGDRLIAVDGVNVAGVDFMLRTTQKLQAYIPLLMHSAPEKVVQIGFGSGETCGIGLAFGVPDYRIVDVCPGIFDAACFFDDINRGSYRDPRLKKVIMDGKNFVKLAGESFDIIMNDSTYPGTTGSSALYTYDHFKQCRDRLRPGGLQSCWMPLDLRPQDFSLILRSFEAAMPHCCLWMADNCLNKHAVLVGSLEPLRLDLAGIEKAMNNPLVAQDLASINIHNAYDLLDCFVLGPDAIRRIAGEGPLNTDDYPALEFGAAIKRDVEASWQLILTAIAYTHDPVAPHVNFSALPDGQVQGARQTLDRYHKATGQVLRGQLAIMDGDGPRMKYHFDLARQINPHDCDVDACLDEIRRERDALVAALAANPAGELRTRLAKRHMLLEEHAQAAEQYALCIAAEPGNPSIVNNLGLCLQARDRPAEALRAFQRALNIDPAFLPAAYNAAGLCVRMGDLEAAVRYYERSAALSPPDRRPYIYNELASACLECNNPGRALIALDKAISLAEGNPALYHELTARRQSLIAPGPRMNASQ